MATPEERQDYLDSEPVDQSDPGQSWYFDVPDGAWERQEQKNRDLRELVRGNLSEKGSKPKAFSGPGTQKLKEQGGGGKERDSDAKRRDEPAAARFEADDEPELPQRPSGSSGPLPLRLRRNGPAPEAMPPEPADGDAPVSRWDSIFGGPADMSIVDSMRAWTKDDEPRKPRTLAPGRDPKAKADPGHDPVALREGEDAGEFDEFDASGSSEPGVAPEGAISDFLARLRNRSAMAAGGQADSFEIPEPEPDPDSTFAAFAVDGPVTYPHAAPLDLADDGDTGEIDNPSDILGSMRAWATGTPTAKSHQPLAPVPLRPVEPPPARFDDSASDDAADLDDFASFADIAPAAFLDAPADDDDGLPSTDDIVGGMRAWAMKAKDGSTPARPESRAPRVALEPVAFPAPMDEPQDSDSDSFVFDAEPEAFAPIDVPENDTAAEVTAFELAAAQSEAYAPFASNDDITSGMRAWLSGKKNLALVPEPPVAKHVEPLAFVPREEFPAPPQEPAEPIELASFAHLEVPVPDEPIADEGGEPPESTSDIVGGMRAWAMKAKGETPAPPRLVALPPPPVEEKLDWDELADVPLPEFAAPALEQAPPFEFETPDAPAEMKFAHNPFGDDVPDEESEWEKPDLPPAKTTPAPVAETAVVDEALTLWDGALDDIDAVDREMNGKNAKKPEKKKGGFFGKLFGKKKAEPEVATPAPESSDWLMPEESGRIDAPKLTALMPIEDGDEWRLVDDQHLTPEREALAEIWNAQARDIKPASAPLDTFEAFLAQEPLRLAAPTTLALPAPAPASVPREAKPADGWSWDSLAAFEPEQPPEPAALAPVEPVTLFARAAPEAPDVTDAAGTEDESSGWDSLAEVAEPEVLALVSDEAESDTFEPIAPPPPVTAKPSISGFNWERFYRSGDEEAAEATGSDHEPLASLASLADLEPVALDAAELAGETYAAVETAGELDFDDWEPVTGPVDALDFDARLPSTPDQNPAREQGVGPESALIDPEATTWSPAREQAVGDELAEFDFAAAIDWNPAREQGGGTESTPVEPEAVTEPAFDHHVFESLTGDLPAGPDQNPARQQGVGPDSSPLDSEATTNWNPAWEQGVGPESALLASETATEPAFDHHVFESLTGDLPAANGEPDAATEPAFDHHVFESLTSDLPAANAEPNDAESTEAPAAVISHVPHEFVADPSEGWFDDDAGIAPVASAASAPLTKPSYFDDLYTEFGDRIDVVDVVENVPGESAPAAGSTVGLPIAATLQEPRAVLSHDVEEGEQVDDWRLDAVSAAVATYEPAIIADAHGDAAVEDSDSPEKDSENAGSDSLPHHGVLVMADDVRTNGLEDEQEVTASQLAAVPSQPAFDAVDEGNPEPAEAPEAIAPVTPASAAVDAWEPAQSWPYAAGAEVEEVAEESQPKHRWGSAFETEDAAPAAAKAEEAPAFDALGETVHWDDILGVAESGTVRGIPQATASIDDDLDFAGFMDLDPAPVPPPAVASQQPAANWSMKPPSTVNPAAQLPPAVRSEHDDAWSEILNAASAYEALGSESNGGQLPPVRMNRATFGGYAATPIEEEVAPPPVDEFEYDDTDDGDWAAWKAANEAPGKPAEENANWELNGNGHDLVLQAFEAHARQDVAEPAPVDDSAELFKYAKAESDDDFDALLGDEAEDLVGEAGDLPVDEATGFSKVQGWAPQRNILTDDEDIPGWASRAGGVSEGRINWSPSAATADDLAPPWASANLNEGEQDTAENKRRARSVVRELVETGLLALLVFLSVRASFQNFKVDGSSMYPTLDNGEFLIVNKLVYSEINLEKLSKYIPFVDPGDDPTRNVFHGPERGDIIVLKHPSHPETDLIKRVIGLPGETIEVREGVVFVNDAPLDEPYITAPWDDTKAKVRILTGEYFVMGDNREYSADSRNPAIGLIPEELVIGRSMLSYWPKDKFGLAPNEAGKVQAATSALAESGAAPLFGWRSTLFLLEIVTGITVVRFASRKMLALARRRF